MVRHVLFVFLIVSLLVFGISCMADAGIGNTVDYFINAIEKTDSAQFSNLIDDDGFIIIRNFVSGGFGIRGQNIRDIYMKKTLPSKLEFSIDEETPFILKDLFIDTISTKKLTECQTSIDMIKIRRNGPPTDEIIEFCGNLLLALSNNDASPSTIVAKGGFVICEAQIICDLPIGSFAIFERLEDKYYIRALIDLK